MNDFSDLEKTVYGIAAPDVRMLFFRNRKLMSKRILNVLKTYTDGLTGLGIPYPELIQRWRTAMETEFSDEEEIKWPEDYDGPPTQKSIMMRSTRDELEDMGVSIADLDIIDAALAGITIPNPE